MPSPIHHVAEGGVRQRTSAEEKALYRTGSQSLCSTSSKEHFERESSVGESLSLCLFPKVLKALAPFLVSERVVYTMHTLCFLLSLVVFATGKVGRSVGLIHCEPLSVLGGSLKRVTTRSVTGKTCCISKEAWNYLATKILASHDESQGDSKMENKSQSCTQQGCSGTSYPSRRSILNEFQFPEYWDFAQNSIRAPSARYTTGGGHRQ